MCLCVSTVNSSASILRMNLHTNCICITHYECEARKLQSADCDKVEWQYLDLEFWGVEYGKDFISYYITWLRWYANRVCICSSVFFLHAFASRAHGLTCWTQNA